MVAASDYCSISGQQISEFAMIDLGVPVRPVYEPVVKKTSHGLVWCRHCIPRHCAAPLKDTTRPTAGIARAGSEKPIQLGIRWRNACGGVILVRNHR